MGPYGLQDSTPTCQIFNFFPNHSPPDHNLGQIFKFRSRQLIISTKIVDILPGIDERPKGPIEKRNLTFFSPIWRSERELWNSFLQFREGKEKFAKSFSTFEKRKRMAFSILRFREEKEKFWKKSQISRREEISEIPYPSFEKRKRNPQKGSPHSRREREMDILFSSF